MGTTSSSSLRRLVLLATTSVLWSAQISWAFSVLSGDISLHTAVDVLSKQSFARSREVLKKEIPMHTGPASS